ncbi:MAG: response regulator [Verrucomicrobiia bacterium]|jgi:DNA-binding NtrC family response regulator
MKMKFDQTEFVRRPHWMVVDDNPDVLSLLPGLLALFSDAEIKCFQSPRAAAAAFKARPGAFDFVITDLEMPGLDGIGLGRQLRALSPTIKILLATGSGILTGAEAVERGFCGLLRKPFLSAALRNALEFAGVIEPRKTTGRKNNFSQPPAFTTA